MAVDDSAVVRNLVTRWIKAESGLELVGALGSASAAIEQIQALAPDVVILDIAMPDLDGLQALPLLLQKKRDLVVIMASTMTRRNAEIGIWALSQGAADYVSKPGGANAPGIETFREELIGKIRHLGRRSQRPRGEIVLRPRRPAVPSAIVIGASTGGPQALTTLLMRLGSIVRRCPILIAQHMPATFTTVLAEQLARTSGIPAREGVDGEPVLPGRIYVAPGGRHMEVTRADARARILVHDGAALNFCRPAVDPLFASAAQVWGSGALGVVLTGMGQDGVAGARAIAAAGGNVIAQDEATSVVWGMPGQVARAGLCTAILPIDAIAAEIDQLYLGEVA
jgi:two-component system chemotaxis response regulator CheB